MGRAHDPCFPSYSLIHTIVPVQKNLYCNFKTTFVVHGEYLHYQSHIMQHIHLFLPFLSLSYFCPLPCFLWYFFAICYPTNPIIPFLHSSPLIIRLKQLLFILYLHFNLLFLSQFLSHPIYLFSQPSIFSLMQWKETV